MFGNNEIVGQKFFKAAPADSLLVTSRFYTLQGEGPYRGVPAYFIRLAKCNLACSFCDTYFDSGEYQTFDALLDESNNVIEQFYADNGIPTPAWASSPVSLYGRRKRDMVLVITGGEPALQQNLAKFLEAASPYFKHTQIESNGTITQEYPWSTTVVVSPKCLEKKGIAVRYLEPKPEMLARANCLKFVMSVPGDEKYAPYSEVPKWALDWKAQSEKRDIYVSPMNIYNHEPAEAKKLHDLRKLDIKERSEVNEVISFWEPGLLNMARNQANHEYAAKYAMKHGCIFNLQLHLFASLA